MTKPGPAAGPRVACHAAVGAAATLFASLCAAPAHADADGPDHFRVRNVPRGHALNLRAEPQASAPRLARIPSDASCLRNLGCRGGLTFEEFTTLSEEDRRRRARENPRWCKVDYQGTVGWADGRYLAEGECAAPTADEP